MKFKYTNNKSGKYTRVVLFKSLLYDQAKTFYNYLCSFNTLLVATTPDPRTALFLGGQKHSAWVFHGL